MNDDARSPGAGSTPGPLSQQPPVLDTSDPGKCLNCLQLILTIMTPVAYYVLKRGRSTPFEVPHNFFIYSNGNFKKL